MEQLLCHLIGDYLFQSHWMATNKTRNNFACFAHVIFYSVPFLFLNPSVLAFIVIAGSHFLIDRFRLARFVVYAKNFLAPEEELFAKPAHLLYPGDQDDLRPEYQWKNCSKTGYSNDTPPYLAVWLLIIADNTLHLVINYFALKFL